MVNKRLSSIMLTMAALPCASTGQPAGMVAPAVVIDQGATGSTVELLRGQKLTISLPGNPTTGFVWKQVPGAESIMVQQGEPRFSSGSRALGAGGVYSFAFKAIGPGSASLKFIYHRPFEKDTAPARTFEVTVVVAKESR